MKRTITFGLTFILILLHCFIQAQQAKIDSLQTVLKTSKEDTSKVNTLNILSKQYMAAGNYEQALQFGKQAALQAEKLNYKKGMTDAYSNIGINYWYQGNYEKSLDYGLKALKTAEEIGYKKGIANSYNNIGIVYFYQGNYQKALDNYLKSLLILEETADKKGIAYCSANIGVIYASQGNYEKALDNYFKALKINEELGNKHGIAVSYNNIGEIYVKKNNFEKSLENHFKALKLYEETGDKQGTASSYINIGNIYYEQGDYKRELANYLKSLNIYEKIGDKRAVGATSSNVGIAYIKLGKLENAFYYLNQSLIISKELGYKDGIKEAFNDLSELYEAKSDYKQAYSYHKLYSDIKDTLLNEQSSKQIAEMNTKYDSEKKDKELIKKDAEISKQQAETEKQNLQRNAFIIGFLLVLILAFFIFRGYRQKQNANKLLEEKNILIENQKQLVEEKNIKITDSINYAKRIQQAILPSQELIKYCFPDSFIFFRPKDIVSGDFYWFSEKGDKLIFAVADCTGHGVPGAFMSMIGNTLLNEIVNVKNILEPSKILNELNKGIVNLLNQSSTDSTTQDDGMDITIIAIDKTMQEMEFAGANHFSYLFNNSQFKTLKGDVFSIGGMFGRADINFTSQKIKIEKGSTIYLFTDGFVDQFGGEKNTKYLSSRFETLLQSIEQTKMEHQKESLITAFDNWKADNKQLDDVLVMGIKI